jgi:predicted HicB family RNase H-like nuclease
VSVHFSTEDKVFHGKIEGITDLIALKAETLMNLRKLFMRQCMIILLYAKRLVRNL